MVDKENFLYNQNCMVQVPFYIEGFNETNINIKENKSSLLFMVYDRNIYIKNTIKYRYIYIYIYHGKKGRVVDILSKCMVPSSYGLGVDKCVVKIWRKMIPDCQGNSYIIVQNAATSQFCLVNKLTCLKRNFSVLLLPPKHVWLVQSTLNTLAPHPGAPSCQPGISLLTSSSLSSPIKASRNTEHRTESCHC